MIYHLQVEDSTEGVDFHVDLLKIVAVTVVKQERESWRMPGAHPNSTPYYSHYYGFNIHVLEGKEPFRVALFFRQDDERRKSSVAKRVRAAHYKLIKVWEKALELDRELRMGRV